MSRPRARSIVNGLVFAALLAQCVWLIGHAAGPPHRLNALKGSVVAFTTILSSGYVATRTATTAAILP